MTGGSNISVNLIIICWIWQRGDGCSSEKCFPSRYAQVCWQKFSKWLQTEICVDRWSYSSSTRLLCHSLTSPFDCMHESQWHQKQSWNIELHLSSKATDCFGFNIKIICSFTPIMSNKRTMRTAYTRVFFIFLMMYVFCLPSESWFCLQRCYSTTYRTDICTTAFSVFLCGWTCLNKCQLYRECFK